MDFVLKRGMGGIKQIGLPIVDSDAIAVYATFANNHAQHLLLSALIEGLRQSGQHTVRDLSSGKVLTDA